MADHLPSLKSNKPLDEAIQPEQDFFPLGLHASDEQLEALQLGGAQIGDERLLMAVVRVTSISEDKRASGKSSRSVSMDLIEGTTTPKPQAISEEDKASTLFGSTT